MQGRYSPWVFISILFHLFILISCGRSGDAAAALGEVPDTVAENFRQVTVTSQGRLEIESRRVETYSKSDRSVFTGARLREIAPEGDVRVEGSADLIEVTGDRDGIARGSVRVADLAGDARVEADELEWKDRDRTLAGKGVVRIESGDGIIISGRGFIADMARETFRFTDGAEGTLEFSDE
jgi:LPS export ABC transporter protein LptC